MGLMLASALYVNTLSLPFFEDDARHIRWLSQISSPLTPFITASGVPAYRPLGKMLLKLWYLLLGRHDAAWLRFLNISMHSLNIAFVAAVARRLDNGRYRYVTAGTAAVLFGVFPFAYQAIPWINVFFYPLNNLLQISMVAVYWQARVRLSNPLLAIALILCALSPFEIEYGLVSGGLLLLVEITLYLQRRQKSIWLTGPLLGLLLNVGFLLIWLIVPKSAYHFGPPTAERVMQIAFYLLQGLAYPVAPAMLSVFNLTGLNDLSSIALIGLPSMIAVTALLAFCKKHTILVTSFLWYTLLNLPGLVTLTFDYVINSPRLLYPSGPALAWLWSAVPAALLAFDRKRPARLVLAGASGLALLLVAGMNFSFVRTRMVHYHIAEKAIHQLGEIAAATDGDETLLFVNMPSWVTPPEKTYVLGNNGIQLIPSYISIEDYVYAANDRDRPTTDVQFHNVRQEEPYFYGLHGRQVDWEGLRAEIARAGEVYLARYEPDSIELMLAGRANGVNWQNLAAGRDVSTFDGSIDLVLVGYQSEGKQLELDLAWYLRSMVREELTVFVHLYGPDGQLVSQDDGYPLSGLSPFWLWEDGQTLEDRRSLSFPEGSPNGVYSVGVGIYDPISGQRLTARDKGGRSYSNNAVILLQFDRL